MDKAYDFNDTLKIGDIVEARFTNSFYYYSFKAIITKVNRNSVRVKSLEKDKPYPDDKKDREFSIIRLTFSTANRWSVNNGIFPIEGR